MGNVQKGLAVGFGFGCGWGLAAIVLALIPLGFIAGCGLLTLIGVGSAIENMEETPLILPPEPQYIPPVQFPQPPVDMPAPAPVVELPPAPDYEAHVTLLGLIGDEARVSVSTAAGTDTKGVGIGDTVHGLWRVVSIDRRPLRVTLRRGTEEAILYTNVPTGLVR